MTTYRKGQRVRIEWPNGSAVEGVLKEAQTNAGLPLSVMVPRAGSETTRWQPDAMVGDDRVVTILSEPRPDEPTGLGAVVTAPLIKGGTPWTFVRTHLDRKPWMADDGATFGYHSLVDPVVVLHEGWTP